MVAALVLFLALAPAAADRLRYPLPCTYAGRTEMETVAHCAAPQARGFAVAPRVVSDFAWRDGLATIRFPGQGWSYRRRDGRTVEMATMDNGPDYSAEGLARARIGGRLAYVDRRLRVRITTRYSFGMPFRGGRAEVCVGGVETPVDGGEHSEIVGGRWGTIDRHGRVIRAPGLPRPA